MGGWMWQETVISITLEFFFFQSIHSLCYIIFKALVEYSHKETGQLRVTREPNLHILDCGRRVVRLGETYTGTRRWQRLPAGHLGVPSLCTTVPH